MSEIEMKVSSLAPWFGSKRTLASTIVEELGPHQAYWEVFCGSMAVLLSKPISTLETANDLHDDLINLARCLQHPEAGPKLYRRLRRVTFDERQFHEIAPRIKDELAPLQSANVGIHPGRALEYFIYSWFGRNGVAGTKNCNTNFCRRFTKNGGSPSKRWTSAVESIPAWRRRLRNVQIISTDGIALCDRIEDAPGTVIYADPPYLKKGAQYQHDFDWLAHRRLAIALRRFTRTRVVVSYYDDPDLAELYPGWTVRPVHLTKSMVSAGQRGETGKAAVAPEVLIINGPSLAGGSNNGN